MKTKKVLMIMSILAVLALAAGCGSEASSGTTAAAGNANSVEAVLEQRAQEDATQGAQPTEEETETTKEAQFEDIYTSEDVDIDLTQLSGTMLYAQVNNMMYKPEEFIGKTVKLPGTFSAVYSEEAQKYYFGCLVYDQAACCTLGVEFELPETYVYPDDYPEEGAEIVVAGTFDTYEEGPYTYCVLRNAQLVS